MPKGIPSGYEQFSLPTMGGDQKQLYESLSSLFNASGPQAWGQVGGLAQGNSELFSQLEMPALRQFEQQIAPGIANRYAGSGIGASSGMQNAIAGAGKSLAEDLQAQRLGIMDRNIERLLGLGDRLLGMPTQQFGLVQKPNMMRDIMQLLGGSVGNIGSIYGGSKLAGLF